jgi:MFS family permease
VHREALAPLRLAPFRLLFAGRATAYLGNAIAPIALAFAVLDLTGSATALGVVLAARSVPQVLLMLVGGVWADRLPRHLVMVGSNLLSAATQAAVAVLLLTGTAQLWHLFVLEAINGAASAFLLPAAAGLTPQTVPAELLQPANALLRLGLNGALIGGSSVAGVLVATVGSGWGMAADALTFAIGAVFLGRLRLPRGERVETTNMLADLVAGWQEFRSRTWVWTIVAAFGVINMAYVAGFSTLGPVVADRTFGRATWGFVLAAGTAGMVVGGLLALRMRPARPLRLGTVAVLLEVPFLFLLADVPVTAVLLVTSFLGGIGFETFGVYWEFSLQQHVPQQVLSRVASYDALGSFVFIPVGQVVAGPLAGALGLAPTIRGAAVVILVTTLAALAVPDVRRLRRTDIAPAASP